MGATVVGKLNNRVKKHKLIILGGVLIIISWIIFLLSPHSIIGLIIGVVLIDLGVQSVYILPIKILFFQRIQKRETA
ncbi:hypothetical protein [Chryseobacterium sp. MP_3.2]|uniref:hypothetical protein n=1 Tax=Chryseobacterium sp. MP_3.2 TaxID=3071712 RepID=UPI002DFCE0EF|nr:putative MFS family arabinose efflux permease [Chryseobacterium sp. MP_3.2]